MGEIADLEEIAQRERDEEEENENEEETAMDDQKEEATTAPNDTKWDGRTYIDVVNFSLTFTCALQDIEKMDGDNFVVAHIVMYRVEEADCNLVKFTRLSGPREAFQAVIRVLSNAAGSYLTGLTDDAWKKVVEPAKGSGNEEDDQRIQELYKKCFPQSNSNGASPEVVEQQEAQ